MPLQIVAVDTGFGNTKFLWPESVGGGVRTGIFRSVAKSVPVRPTTVHGIAMRDTFYVSLGAELLQVGNDVHGAANASLVLSPDYPASNQYMALTLGALAYIWEQTGQSEIERLVLGLPLSTFSKHREMLRARFQGRHSVPTRTEAIAEIRINDVTVIPQPVGSYLAWRKTAKQVGGGCAHEKVVLILDQGEYTFDWLVISNEKVVYERSGATHLGMSEIHKHVAAQFERDLGVSDVSLELMRVGLMDGRVNFRGETVDFSVYMASANAKARTIVDHLMAKAGDMDDVSAVILTGGGAQFFKEALREKLGIDRIEIPENSLFSNVYGFYLSGL